jgi:hypothetical protein
MMILTLIGLVAGIELGMRFTIVVLLLALALIISAVNWRRAGAGGLQFAIVMPAAAAAVSLQSGFITGACVCDCLPTGRAAGLRSVTRPGSRSARKNVGKG